jgi:rRNA pseudouridine-1189 N-methylase Emg1 (Nep1/Mra1 family)
VQLNSEGSWAAPEPGAAIDAALAGLDGLDQLETAEHVGRFDAVHSALTDALSSIDKV